VRPSEEIDGIRSGQARLDVTVATLTPEVAGRPSLLPGWTVAHVLGHLVGNAHSVIRRLEGVIADRVVDQYPGGAHGRAEEIERLAVLPLGELTLAFAATARRVDVLVDEVPDDAWDRVTRGVEGNLSPARAVVFSRWREIEVHHVDLGLGYTFADWPANLVERCLTGLLAGLPDRADHHALAAWAMGRAAAPDLASWS